MQEAGHKLCTCGGYHYAHRPGSPYCIRNPWSEYREAVRRDVEPEIVKEIAAHTAFETPHKKSIDPPF